MTLTNEVKQSGMLKMKCQEKDDQIEVLESDVTYVDLTYAMMGIKIEIFTVQTAWKKEITAASRSHSAIDSNVQFLYHPKSSQSLWFSDIFRG